LEVEPGEVPDADTGYDPCMAKLTNEQVKTILADIERRLLAGEKLTTQDIEAPIKSAGHSYKEAQKLIKKHGSSFLMSRYIESFGNHVPTELKNL
jgi:hypothetical protein